MDFSGITGITIPQGNAKKVLQGSTILWQKDTPQSYCTITYTYPHSYAYNFYTDITAYAYAPLYDSEDILLPTLLIEGTTVETTLLVPVGTELHILLYGTRSTTSTLTINGVKLIESIRAVTYSYNIESDINLTVDCSVDDTGNGRSWCIITEN